MKTAKMAFLILGFLGITFFVNTHFAQAHRHTDKRSEFRKKLNLSISKNPAVPKIVKEAVAIMLSSKLRIGHVAGDVWQFSNGTTRIVVYFKSMTIGGMRLLLIESYDKSGPVLIWATFFTELL